MAIQFPTDPGVTGVYTYNNKTWVWNGLAWDFNGSVAIIQGVTASYGSHIFSHGAIDPIEEVVYMFGDIPDDLPVTSLDAGAEVRCLYNGTVESYSITTHTGATGSSENSTILLYNHTLGSTATLAPDINHFVDDCIYYIAGETISVNEGDILSCYWQTPAWATNPMQVRTRVEIKIKVSI